MWLFSQASISGVLWSSSHMSKFAPAWKVTFSSLTHDTKFSCILNRKEVTTEQKVKLSYLYKHMADVFVSSFGCSMERGALVLRIHLEVWVDAINWKEKNETLNQGHIKNQKIQNETEKSRTDEQQEILTYPAWAGPSSAPPAWLTSKVALDENAAFLA